MRSALELLAELPGQLLETDVEVEPMAQLSGVYRYVGAGGTVKRPTKEGPAMIFHNVKGHPDASVAIGVLASRKRVAALLDCKPEELGKMLCRSVEKPVLPVMCQGNRPASRWCTGLMSRILTCISWFLRQPTHPMTPAHILLWACAMPPIRIQGLMM